MTVSNRIARFSVDDLGNVKFSFITITSRSHWAQIFTLARRGGMTITDVIIKTLDRKIGLGMWMMSCPEAMGWGFWVIFEKKHLVEIGSWTKRVDFWTWARPIQLWTTGCLHVVGSDGTVSIVKIGSLSPRVEKPKSQESNKSFVPELPRVISVSGFLCIWTYTFPYISRIVLWLCY